MNRTHNVVFASFLAGAWCCTTALGDWVQFVDESETRLISDSSVGINDNQEKDYDWGDLNNNGWIDLVVMRKQPFTTSGRRINVLFMNENGVLVDRTEQYATDSDVSGDLGFLTPTNDRDVRVVDVDNDGWKDVVTATTLSDGQPKHISYPRVYINKANDPRGNWQGLRYEDARIPQFEGNAPSGAPHAPRFCAVAAGDVTGNGYADLYFADYDSGGSQTLDFNDRLLINDGNGYFADESTQRINPNWLSSNFGAQAVIEDLNGNGVNDIVKVNALGAYHTAAIYNDPNNPGYFMSHQIVQNSSTYFAVVGDINNSGRLDIVIADDGNDRYRLNMGNQSNGQVAWSSLRLLSGPTGFRSNVVVADLNKNGWKDILIADVDVDLGSCTGSQPADIYRSNANGINVTFTLDRGNIPVTSLRRTFDFAVFDLTGNGWLDVIAGRCAGTNVFINQPSFGIDFMYPQGRPVVLVPDEPTPIEAELSAFGQDLDPDGVTLHVSVDGGEFQAISMSNVSGNTFAASIPPVDCSSRVEWYIRGELSGGGVATDPFDAPRGAYGAVAADGTQVAFFDDMEGSVADWTVTSDSSLTGGEWEQAVPVGTICCGGQLASPDGDASADPNGMAFTTENCEPNQFPGGCNVQHGPTFLTSPVIDLEGSDAIISYDRWFFSSGAADPSTADFLFTQVSNDGGQSWVTVHSTGGTNSQWQNASFLVSDFVEPTAEVRVRFVAEDEGNNSITNAGIDNFSVDEFTCGQPCVGDLTGSGVVDVSDLLILLGAWGPCPRSGDCPGDLTGSGVVDVSDLLVLLGNWGPCN